jgi:hypothetical protein
MSLDSCAGVTTESAWAFGASKNKKTSTEERYFFIFYIDKKIDSLWLVLAWRHNTTEVWWRDISRIWSEITIESACRIDNAEKNNSESYEHYSISSSADEFISPTPMTSPVKNHSSVFDDKHSNPDSEDSDDKTHIQEKS